MISIRIRYTTIALTLLAVLSCFSGCEKDVSLLPTAPSASFILAGSSENAHYVSYNTEFYGWGANQDLVDINNDGETDFIFESDFSTVYGGAYIGTDIKTISTGLNCEILMDTTLKTMDTVRSQYGINTYGSKLIQRRSPQKLDSLSVIDANGYWDTTAVMKNLYSHYTSFLFDTIAGAPINGTIQRTYQGWGSQDKYLGFKINTSSNVTLIGWLHLYVGYNSTTLIDAAYVRYIH